MYTFYYGASSQVTASEMPEISHNVENVDFESNSRP
jgi:hypothetical protein